MNFLTAPNGHLYQSIMALGAFILIGSCYSLAVAFESHDAKLLIGVDHLLNSKEDDAKRFWSTYLEVRKRDTETVIGALLAGFIIGATMTVGGGIAWYFMVQRCEDKKRRLENEQLEHAVESVAGRKRLHIAS